MSAVNAWEALSSIITVIAVSVAALLTLACLWPEPDRRPPHARSRARNPYAGIPAPWPAHWSCDFPGRPLTVDEAHRAMQLHREHDCARKRVAMTMLVAEGRITPDSSRHYRRRARA
ncbi:hypothetical protein [Nocardia macrotermitis]|uniref:Uncharacterized protein n=1 Tax=Nocardia macrotermitis TaxID=2585198 RepID=A0A7K0DF46_9NOCA|nr:hypothetical protein [Nocardia macrotermitis]MQY23464.1 hypothetical protein [Nocardia macrotermitis]